MKTTLTRILVILPAIFVSLFYVKTIYNENYSHASSKRVWALALSLLLLYLLFVFITFRRKQHDIYEGFVLASFFVYLFFVLQLTGYFILFKEISSHGWWNNMIQRVNRSDHVNFTLFKTINIYSLTGKQVAGNFVMLLPLGIYLPLLYQKLRKVSGFFTVTLISLMVSVGIEVLQLATNYRSCDVDDVMLNTLGGTAGFILFQLLRLIIVPKPAQ